MLPGGSSPTCKVGKGKIRPVSDRLHIPYNSQNLEFDFEFLPKEDCKKYPFTRAQRSVIATYKGPGLSEWSIKCVEDMLCRHKCPYLILESTWTHEVHGMSKTKHVGCFARLSNLVLWHMCLPRPHRYVIDDLRNIYDSVAFVVVAPRNLRK